MINSYFHDIIEIIVVWFIIDGFSPALVCYVSRDDAQLNERSINFSWLSDKFKLN